MRSLTVMAFLFSFRAFACPDLSGTFSCTFLNGAKETIVVSQAENCNVTTYTINGQPYAADNIAYAQPDTPNLRDSTVRMWCDDDTTLQSETLGRYFDDQNHFGGALELKTAFTLQDMGVRISSKGTLGGVNPIGGEADCTKN